MVSTKTIRREETVYARQCSPNDISVSLMSWRIQRVKAVQKNQIEGRPRTDAPPDIIRPLLCRQHFRMD